MPFARLGRHVEGHAVSGNIDARRHAAGDHKGSQERESGTVECRPEVHSFVSSKFTVDPADRAREFSAVLPISGSTPIPLKRSLTSGSASAAARSTSARVATFRPQWGEGLIVSRRGGIMRRTTAAVLCVLVLAWSAAAQDFPSKPVRLVVPFPPGGPLDISGRLIGKELQDHWGQPVIVENKPGSTIGPEYVAKSAPDGYTLMIISSTPFVTLPHLQKVPYDVLKDLVGVTQTTLLTYAFVVNPASGIGSIQDLIARAKKEPGRLNYASAGNGSGQHLYVELLKSAADMNLTHVPYKGAAPALQAVLAGEPGMMLDVTVAVMPHVKAGKLRALMVTGSAPLEQLPGAVPFDSLFPGLGIPGWHGIFATGGAPKPILDKLAADIRAVLALPAVTSRFRELGVEPSGVSGEEFNAIVRRDYARWGEIIRANKLRAD